METGAELAGAGAGSAAPDTGKGVDRPTTIVSGIVCRRRMKGEPVGEGEDECLVCSS
jgi:hypothetical protein